MTTTNNAFASVAAAVSSALAGAGIVRPVGMPETAIPLMGNVWSAVIDVNDWIGDDHYKGHEVNRDAKKAAEKKTHLRGELETDIQKTVVACLDDQGDKTKLDGHCRGYAWKMFKDTNGEKGLALPEDGKILCIIHVLPEGERHNGEYARKLLRHAVNKEGALTATEQKITAQKWVGALSGYTPSLESYVAKTLSKAAITEALKAKAEDTVFPDGLNKDFENNLLKIVEFRKVVDSLGFDVPKKNPAISDADRAEQDLKARRYAFSATMLGAFMACYYIKGAKEAATYYFRHWGTNKAPEAAQASYQTFIDNQGDNAAGKTERAKFAVARFDKWFNKEWEAIKEDATKEEQELFAKWWQSWQEANAEAKAAMEAKEGAATGKKSLSLADRIEKVKAQLELAAKSGLPDDVEPVTIYKEELAELMKKQKELSKLQADFAAKTTEITTAAADLLAIPSDDVEARKVGERLVDSLTIEQQAIAEEMEELNFIK